MTQAPWWLAILLVLVTAGATHFLTLWRESSRAGREWLEKWEKRVTEQATKVSDAAVRHYISPDSVANTAFSAQLIILELKRLQGLIAETTAVAASDARKVSAAYRQFHDTISIELDFQDPNRTARAANDPIVGRISTAELNLVEHIRRGRARKR